MLLAISLSQASKDSIIMPIIGIEMLLLRLIVLQMIFIAAISSGNIYKYN